MKLQFNQYLLILLALVQFSCGGGENSSMNQNANDSTVQATQTEGAAKEKEGSKRTKQLCDNFPKDLILNYHPDGKRIEIEPVELIPGQLSSCKVKLFYGDKEYEFWEGVVSVYAPKTENPFWQYNPERSPSLYKKVDEFGDKAVYLENSYQLLILKDGLIYSIVPPNNGSHTSSGKETKEITFELARHYKL